MLWTDKIFVSADDLASIDAEISEVSESEGVPLEGPNGFIRRQIDESGEEVLRRMEVYGGWIGSSTLSANHIQAVLNIGGGAAASRTKILLDQIVISDRIIDRWSYLKRWVAYRTVAAFYRNVSGRSASKDRYRGKQDDYTKFLRQVQNQALLDLGLPICYQPLPRPAAFMSYISTGSFDGSNLSEVAGAGTMTAEFDVAVTYLDMSRYVNPFSNISTGNAESAPSDVASIQVTTGNVLQVDVSTLNPPIGQDPGTMSLCVMTPLTPTHWNLYVGLHGQTMWLQNPLPIALGTQQPWTTPQLQYSLPADPVLGPAVGANPRGFPMPNGQWADRRYQFQLLIQRA